MTPCGPGSRDRPIALGPGLADWELVIARGCWQNPLLGLGSGKAGRQVQGQRLNRWGEARWEARPGGHGRETRRVSLLACVRRASAAAVARFGGRRRRRSDAYVASRSVSRSSRMSFGSSPSPASNAHASMTASTKVMSFGSRSSRGREVPTLRNSQTTR